MAFVEGGKAVASVGGPSSPRLRFAVAEDDSAPSLEVLLEVEWRSSSSLVQ